MSHKSPDYWQPHTSGQPIPLPPIPPSTSSASSSKKVNWKLPIPKKVKPWITGATIDDIVDIEPEVAQAYQERWELKWKHFSENPSSDIQATGEKFNKMNANEAKKQIDWINGDFQRIINRLTDLDITQSQAELTTGRVFVTSLIEENIHLLLSTENMELEFTKDMLNKAELVHQFALQSLTHIIMTHNKQQIEKRSKRVYPLLNTSSEPDLDLSSHTYEEIPGSRSYPLNPISPPTQSNPSLSAMNVTPPSTPPAFVIAPQGPVHNAAPNQQGFNFAPLLEAPNPMPVINQPQLPLQSTVQSSHKTSVTALLTMGFFGASIAWSTVFSGTRGNIALLAWAACTFIVATVCAASASLLITSEEQIIEKHQRVRWVVRILSRLASLHIFTGLILLSVTILLLDPNQGDISVDPQHGASMMKAAGIYALIMSIFSLAVSVVVWHRYTHRRWYY